MICLLAACTSPGGAPSAPAGPPQEPTPAGLEAAIRTLHAGMASSDPAEQERALRAILPARADVEFLFPKDAAALWPVLEESSRELLSHRADIAEETRKGGAIRAFETIDVRAGPHKDFVRVLPMLPADVPVCLTLTKRETSSAGSGTYLFVRGRWIWIRGLQGVPEFLEKSR